MIRLTALWLFIVALALYAWRDWYRALCGLILLMGVIQHPDMPKSMLGVQGLNPWNVLFLVVVVAWLVGRRREGLKWDMPGHVVILLLGYFAVVVVSFARMIGDTEKILVPHTTAGLVSEHLINAVKWTIPGMMLFDGARSRQRLWLGLFAVLGQYVLIAIQVIKWMPIQAALTGDELNERAIKLVRRVGWHRVNLSMMLGGASWAAFAAHVLPRRSSAKLGLLLLAMLLLFAQSLTGGRAGYGTWAAVGLVLCTLRWRRYLLAVPIAVALVLLVVPGAGERLAQGFTRETQDGRSSKIEAAEGDVDAYTITAGRNLTWPLVIEKIKESPWTGWGKLAMWRTGLTYSIYMEYGGELFPHPHNAYLELLLDNGIVGFVPVILLFSVMLKRSMSLLLDGRSQVFVAIGGATTALILALLVASIGSQTFYPREGAVGMWCAIGLMLRVWVERRRAAALALEAPPPSPIPAAAGSFLARQRRRSPPSLDPFLWRKVR